MALVLADRVQETTNTTGTGTLTLAGAATGFQSFAAIGNGNVTYYAIVSGTDWEVGLGTYTAVGTTLSRDVVLSSSAGGTTKITVAAGATVFSTYPASKAVTSQQGYFDSTFQGTFVDGIAIDYDSVGANGRISVGGADSISFYNGGPAGSLLGTIANNGDWSITRFLDIGPGTLIAGATNPVFAAAASANNYVQAYIHNDQNGTSSSSDFTCYPSNGSDASGWADIGITSPAYADAVYTVTGPNESYLFASAPSGSGTSGNLVYATDSTGTANYHQWYTGGFAQAKSAWKMQLRGTALDLSVPLNSTVATGTAPFTVASTTPVANLSIGGNAATATTATSATTATTATNLSGGTAVFAAGTATVPPVDFSTGVLMTTAQAGAMEFDGTAPYFSIAASTRGVLPTEQWTVLNATYTLTSQTAAQKIFNATTNGAVTLPVGLYQFECVYALTGMSATSGSFGFALGGAATKTYAYLAMASKGTTTALTTASAATSTFNTGAQTTLNTASTGTAGTAIIKGTIRVTVAGTIIPQVSLTVASAAIIQAGSYFRVSPIAASATTTTVGNWS